MDTSPYVRLAARLDELPNGFPPAPDGAGLRLLELLFTPEQAGLTAQLRLTLETPAQIAERVGGDPQELRSQLKKMVGQGLIRAGRAPAGGLGFGLLPFVVGIYEMQGEWIDARLAQAFEEYYQQAFGRSLTLQPPLHRVIPVNQTVRTGIEVRPFESAAEIVAQARAWAVIDCICRKQQALIGQPCEHPVDVCLALSQTPGAFNNMTAGRALTQEEALQTLRRAAEAGLVHSVANSQDDVRYICSCCTCACAILRGMVELGIAGVIASSPFVCSVDADACLACGACSGRCSFGALTLGDDGIPRVDAIRCAGCGVCAVVCPQDALSLVRRSEPAIEATPQDEEAWLRARAAFRGGALDTVL